jgi:hypothetical protein
MGAAPLAARFAGADARAALEVAAAGVVDLQAAESVRLRGLRPLALAASRRLGRGQAWRHCHPEGEAERGQPAEHVSTGGKARQRAQHAGTETLDGAVPARISEVDQVGALGA